MGPVTRALMFAAVILAIAGWTRAASAQTAAPKAHSAKPAAQHAQPKAAPPSKSAATHVTPVVATGTIASFDETTHMLTISTPKGQEQFMLGASARIQRASRSITPADLQKLNGYEVKVRYTESGGTRSVQSVQVNRNVAKATK